MRAALLLIPLLTIVACRSRSRPSGLTEGQVDQMLATQHQTQAEYSRLAEQRDQLEADRRQWDQRAQRDPVIAESISQSTLLITCCLPLLIILYLVARPSTPEEADTVANEILVEDLTSETPRITGRQPSRIEDLR